MNYAIIQFIILLFCFLFYLTLILLRLFQQHYCYNVTGQSQESEGSCKPARIKEVHSKLHSFQASLCTVYTVTTLILLSFKELYGLGSNWLSYYSVNYTIIQLIILLFSELYYYSVNYTIIQ